MRMCEHLNSDEELMPSFCECNSPDSEDDDDFLPDFEFDTAESYLMKDNCFHGNCFHENKN